MRETILGCCITTMLPMLLLLNGCTLTHGPNATSFSLMDQEIYSRTSTADTIIDELRTAEGFHAIATTLPDSVIKQMMIKKSWQQGCPVGLNDLCYIVLTHWGFEGQIKVGELVVHRKLVSPVMNSFAELFSVHYPIDKMELIEKYDGKDDLSMAANNSSAFNCRSITGKPGVFSKHSYGGAIDLNPLQNPYVAPKGDVLNTMGWDRIENKGEFLRRNGYDAASPALRFCTQRPTDCLVLPHRAAEYVNRNRTHPAYLQPNSSAVNAFVRQGFIWGGNWSSLLDYQHFEYDNAAFVNY